MFCRRFGPAEKFFAGHFVANFCPLAFLSATGSNVTPDKLARAERERVTEICDAHLRRVVAVLEPEWVVGVGAFARNCAERVAGNSGIRIGQVLHPSPPVPKPTARTGG